MCKGPRQLLGAALMAQSLATLRAPTFSAPTHRALSHTAMALSALLLTTWVTPANAQQAPEEHADPGPSAQSNQTEPARVPPSIEAPRPLSTPVDYPEGGEGEHVVVLELLVDEGGAVTESRALSGDEPFATFANEAARSWRFLPATRDGEKTAARIRFEVRFVPESLASDAPAGTTTNETPQAGEPAPSSPTEPTATEEPILQVTVVGERAEGERSLSRAEVRAMPGSFGDAFRAVEILPGVTPIISGLPYFFVRGAPPGNVGYFLDGVRVPLLFHIAAGPSVIHPAFIDSVELYAGPYPARYGRFAGGIVAGETAPPTYEHRGEASIRLVDAGGMLETHAFDRRLSVMAAGRYSYTALIASLLAPDLSLSYWDYQGRIQYQLNNRETLTLFSFGALDQASEKRPGADLEIFDLIFHRLDLRYERHLESGGHLRAAVTGGYEVTGIDVFDVGDQMLAARMELDQGLTEAVVLRTGVDFQVDRYTTSLSNLQDDDQAEEESEDEDVADSAEEFVFPARVDYATGIHGDIVWEVEPGVRFTPGLRAEFFVADGSPLWGLEPRLYAEFDVRRNVTLKHGLGLVHQLPSFALPLPGVQPVGTRGLQRSIQHSAGVEWRLPEDITAEATVFQNIQLNVTDLLSAIRFDDLDEDAFAQDQRALGSARGFELFVRRSLTKRLGGYVSYTFSRSTRSFGRQSGPSSFDRAHVLGAAVGYQLGKGWNVGVRGSFYTGIPPQTMSSHYDFRYPPRTRPFYRVDWRVEKRWSIGESGSWIAFVTEVLNTTLNKEVISMECNRFGCTEEPIGPVTIPSIGVEASF